MGELFGTSGIRGVFNLDMTPMLAQKAGVALAMTLEGNGSVAVGTDHRTSAETIKRALISGILSGGCDVMDVGLAPTPTIAFAGARLGCDAAVSITASHNPPEYNGIKFWDPDGAGFSREQEAEIERQILSGALASVEWSNIGQVYARPHASRSHIDAIIATVGVVDGFSVVYDGGCGAGSTVTPYLLRKLGCKTFTLNAYPDGRFDAREHKGEEPIPDAGEWDRIIDLANLVSTVVATGADLGLANDGDADRLLVVDETGAVVPLDVLIAFFAEMALEKKGDTIVTTMDASMLVDKVAERHGAKVVRTPVGDIFVSRAVKEHGAVLGAEPAGTFIFPDLHLCPDGPLSAAKAVRALAERGELLSEVVAGYDRYPMGRVRLDCSNKRKATVMDLVANELEDAIPGIESIDTADGIRVAMKNGWVLVRPSGTEPIIRVTAEAQDDDALQAFLAKARAAVADIIARMPE